jgi:hypothetical protein
MSRKRGDSRKSKSIETISIPEEDGLDGLRQALPDIISQLVRRIEAELVPSSWNRLYFSLWLDSGRLILFPHNRGDLLSRHPFTIQVESSFLLREYDDLPDPEDDEALFESHYAALEGRVLQCILHALKTSESKRILKKLRQNNDFKMWFLERDDTETLVPLG